MNKLMTKPAKSHMRFYVLNVVKANVKEPLFTKKIILLIKLSKTETTMMLYALETIVLNNTRTD